MLQKESYIIVFYTLNVSLSLANSAQRCFVFLLECVYTGRPMLFAQHKYRIFHGATAV